MSRIHKADIPNAELNQRVYTVPDQISSKVASGRWNIESIITHEFPWENLPRAIEQAAKVNGALNVVIRY